MTLAILDARDKEYVVVAAGADLIATYVQQAILAGETAQEVLDAILAAGLSEGVFPSLAAGESGTTDGQYFWVGDGGTVTLYLNNSGTGDEIAELATMAALATRPTFTELADPSGADLSGYQQRDDTAVLTVEKRLQESFSVRDGRSNPATDWHSRWQEVADLIETGKKRYLYAPNFDQNYLLSAPVLFTSPGVRIFGDQSATYNRGAGKEGWLQVAGTHALDFGNNRTTGNPADQWTLERMGFKPASGTPVRTVDGVHFSSRTDGPDRGAVIDSCSFKELKDAISTQHADVSTNIACLQVTNTVIHQCQSAVNAKGRVLGLHFCRNQAEQNVPATGEGVIRGSFHGPVRIDDNMLEGQPTPVSIDLAPTFGSAAVMKSSLNYFEANTGRYVYRLRCSTFRGAFIIGPNYAQSLSTDDFVLVEDTAGAFLLDTYDEFPVCFNRAACTLKYGSDIMRNRISTYYVRQVAAPAEVIISKFQGLTDVDNDHVHFRPSVGTVMQTPFGERLCSTGNTFMTIPLAVTAGDFVVVNLLMRASEVAAGNFNPQVYDNTSAVILREWGSSPLPAELNGRWALVSLAFTVLANSTNLRMRFTTVSGTFNTAVAGISAKNHGAHTNDGTVRKTVKPVMPKLPIGLASYTFATLPSSPAAGDQALVTDSSVTTFRGAVAGGGANIVPVHFNGSIWVIG